MRGPGRRCLADRDLAEAFSRYRNAPERCSACHGAVIVLAAYKAGSRPSFSHLKAHSGCPLKAVSFSGTASPHPEALS